MSDLPRLALEEAVLKALADQIAARLRDVRAGMQAALDSTGASRVAAALPDGTKVATVSLSEPKPTAVVTDEKAYLGWVREHSPANVVTRLITEARPAYTAALLAEMTAAGVAQWADKDTGEVHNVPGVEIRATRARSHSVRPVKGGPEAIAAAWRSGQLAHLNLPQLNAGEDA